MPELPDVELFKRYLDRTALHQRIKQTRVLDDTVIQEISGRTVQRRLTGHALESSLRRGKHLLVEIGGDGWLGLHFGMTGFLEYAKDLEALPEHTRIRLDFDGGGHLAYVCQRKLGGVRILDDLEAFIEAHDLGPDALELHADMFVERVAGRRGAIKTTLMNQKVLAGLGNVYTDEILFHARVHPEVAVSDLSEGDLRHVFQTMRHVLRKAIDAGADPGEMPSSWLLPRREAGASCPRCDATIERHEVGGRATWICPRCQRS